MAGVRAIDTARGRFSIMAVYDEYEAIVSKTTDALEREGEEAAQRLIRFFADRYRHALAKLVDPKGYEARKQKAIEDAALNASQTKSRPPSAGKTRQRAPKVDLMEGFEFPDDTDVAKNVGQSAARFQPLASSFVRPSQASSQPTPKDRPSMDLFQVTAFTQVETADSFETPQVEAYLAEPQSGVQHLYKLAGFIAVVGGLILAIMGVEGQR